MRIVSVALLVSLSGCVSGWDMQGVDPKDYYAAHPIKNRVEQRSDGFTVVFAPHSNKLDAGQVQRLRTDIHAIAPATTQSIQIEYAEQDRVNHARREHVAKLLRSMGYTHISPLFEPSPSLLNDEMRVTITHTQLVLPRCPDWRLSPVTSYSNTVQGNFGCATEVNLGLMVADPNDLERGSGLLSIDTERAGKVIEEYRSNKDYSASAAGKTPSGSAVAAGLEGTTGQ